MADGVQEGIDDDRVCRFLRLLRRAGRSRWQYESVACHVTDLADLGCGVCKGSIERVVQRRDPDCSQDGNQKQARNLRHGIVDSRGNARLVLCH